MNTPARIAWIVGLLFLAPLAAAQSPNEFVDRQGWLHLNGYTHHFAAPDANDKIFGLGLTWYVRRFGRPVVAWEVDAYQDSAKKFSGYVGRSWTFPLGESAAVGVTGALMYHRNFRKQNFAGVLPVALPFLEARGRTLKLRAYYIPPVRSRTDHQIAVQLMVPLWR